MDAVWAYVFALTGLLGLAVLMSPAARRVNFPYTVLLAVVGCLLGLVTSLVAELNLGPLTDFLVALNGLEITSEEVLFIFLPVLVFEAALAIDVRRLIDDLAPILVMAVFGFLISTIIIAYAVYSFAEVSLIACLLLGAIVSATDPVAVVAMFKELGAPKRLAILVEGESLFNDAAAIVAFTIFAAMVAGTAEADVVGGVLTFLKVFIGGGVVGYIMARLFCLILSRLQGLPLVEVTLTITLAYFAFLFAEHYLHVSGVVAVVVAALVLGSYGRTTISPGTWHILTETWELIGFWANSLIFILVGLAVPRILTDVTMTEIGLLAVVIVAALAGRAFLVYALLPIMSGTGMAHSVSNAFKAVMWWGGLRGAVSLALALAVMENSAIAPEVQRFVAILVTGLVLFTLFINATTIRHLMSLLGLDQLTPSELAVRNRALALSLANVREQVEQAATSRDIDSEVARDVYDTYDARQREAETGVSEISGITDEAWLQIGLATLLNQERKSYLRMFAEGHVGTNMARTMLGRVDDLSDALKTHGVEGYKTAAAKSLEFGLGFRLAMQLQRRLGMDGPLAGRLAERLEGVTAMRSVLDHDMPGAIRRARSMVGAETAEVLEGIIDARRHDVLVALDALKLQYPDYARALEECFVGRIALRLEEADYKALLNDSVISPEVYTNLEESLDERARELESRPSLDLGLEPEKLVAKVPFFANLPAERIQAIVGMLKPRLVIPGESIVHKGDAGDAMFFISTGACRVEIEPEAVQLGSGDFFGELSLLTQNPRNADVVALGFCEVLTLYVRDFHTLLAENPEMRETIEAVAAQRMSAN